MNRKTLTQLTGIIGVVLALMLAGGAPDEFGILVIRWMIGS